MGGFFSFSLCDLLGVTFVSLLTHSFTGLQSRRSIQFYYLWCVLPKPVVFLFSLLALRLFLPVFQGCIWVSDHWRVVCSAGASHIILCLCFQGLCYLPTPSLLCIACYCKVRVHSAHSTCTCHCCPTSYKNTCNIVKPCNYTKLCKSKIGNSHPVIR